MANGRHHAQAAVRRTGGDGEAVARPPARPRTRARGRRRRRPLPGARSGPAAVGAGDADARRARPLPGCVRTSARPRTRPLLRGAEAHGLRRPRRRSSRGLRRLPRIGRASAMAVPVARQKARSRYPAWFTLLEAAHSCTRSMASRPRAGTQRRRAGREAAPRRSGDLHPVRDVPGGYVELAETIPATVVTESGAEAIGEDRPRARRAGPYLPPVRGGVQARHARRMDPAFRPIPRPGGRPRPSDSAISASRTTCECR